MPTQYIPCEICSTPFRPYPHRPGRFCSARCYTDWRASPARFWSKVNKHGPVPSHVPERGPCWLWAGHIDAPTGYGMHRHQAAHRLSYKLTYGDIPPGQQVLHRCDVRACVRPTHLFVGTHRDNMADMARKGRAARGEQNGAAKLTEANVRSILDEWARDGCGIRRLAREFGVDKKVVSDIVRGRGWKHLQQPSA